MTPKYSYSIYAANLLAGDYSRADVESVGLQLVERYPEVAVYIDWTGPHGPEWRGDGSTESDDLHDEVRQVKEKLLQGV
jgi:hypothetical protein